MINPSTGTASFNVAAPTGITLAASLSPAIFDGLRQKLDATDTSRTTDVTLTVSGDSTTTISFEKVTG
jgi:hypothetical protein